MTENIEVDRDELPFVAPCRKLSPWAPFRWLRLGIRDLVQAPQHSMAYGLTVALLALWLLSAGGELEDRLRLLDGVLSSRNGIHSK